MSRYALKKTAFDPGALEDEIQRRLRRGKAKLLVSHALCFLLTAAVIYLLF